MFFDVKINMHLFFSGRSEVFTAGKGTSRKLGVNFDEQIRFAFIFLPSMLKKWANGLFLNHSTELLRSNSGRGKKLLSGFSPKSSAWVQS